MQRYAEAYAVGIIAYKPAISDSNGIACSYLFAERIKLVQVFQHLYLVGLGDGKARKGHIAYALYNILQLSFISLGIEIEHIFVHSPVRRILHTGGERLVQGLSQQGYKLCADIDWHGTASFTYIDIFIISQFFPK